MRIIGKSLEKDSSGYVRLVCEEDEDMWHVYNLVREGDVVKSGTVRKVTQESTTGSKSSQRIQMTLAVVVETIDFDPSVCTLHLKGRNVKESEHVKLGAYHTIDLQLQRPFTLEKAQWDSMDLHRLELSADIANNADVAAIVMHEGLAHLCLISASMTVIKSKIDMPIAKKRKGLTGAHDKQLQAFFNALATAFVRFVNFDIVKCVLIASPGFLRDQFLDYLMRFAESEGNKTLLTARSRFMLVHSSSGFKHSLTEVLSDCGVAQRLADTKAQSEMKAFGQFMEFLGTDPHRAVYGFKHVQMASDRSAIETMMVSDSLFRSKSIAERKKYVQLVETVKEQGATVLIFSSMHVTGEQLSRMTGVAAILRFPLADIDEWDDDETSNDNDNVGSSTPSK